MIDEAWDLPGLREHYEQFVATSHARARATARPTFAAQTALVHAWRRFPFIDPDLPDDLLPRDWPRRRANELFRDRHDRWAPAAQAHFDALAAMTRRKRIYVAYAGGTIGMQATDTGYAPVPGHLTAGPRPARATRAEVPDWSSTSTRRCWTPPTPARPTGCASRATSPSDADDFDGFVVLHGTDTMAYTASALAFLLRGLDRPVVVTGAQIPLGVLRSDGRQNLLTAVLVAARDDVREVCLVFGSQILRGCRAVKTSASGFEAFNSPNLPPLGSAGVEIELHAARLRPPSVGAVTLPAALDAPVNLLRLYPGMPAELLRAAVAPPARGLVLEAYGAGNLPDRDEALLDALAEGARRGVVVVAVSPVRRRPRGSRRLRGQRAAGGRRRGRGLRHDHRGRLRQARRPAVRGPPTRHGPRAPVPRPRRRAHTTPDLSLPHSRGLTP